MDVEVAGLFETGLYETVSYQAASGSPVSISAIFVPITDEMPLVDGVETRNRVGNFVVAASAVSAITLTIGVDTITRTNGDVYTVLGRVLGAGAIWKYECVLRTLQGMQHRGRVRF
jgi:hypothetical protein